ncbi:hypothetical protein JX265_006724 [Neoarthrinium moseri]|uniref:Uncharacterized protein n=1 Tax=Neoarthrinium moseri TaxID=1658444 RepID=A0A9Q0ALF7_9PEZI|nr:uncharacterized protein JN550_002804 [Neoarthrinium moseri]KAI1847082.1 hypothetical protein JX266_006957 [Neoarthrinium moseri]KAI1868745.1 hypothetical protein JX265_006724 [Neoarthrinium moseri]KAI1874225.1 hypothetical protein JN550_002804 [Neoarthrinium moseri]
MAFVVAIVYKGRAILIEQPIVPSELAKSAARHFGLTKKQMRGLEIKQSKDCFTTWSNTYYDSRENRNFPREISSDVYMTCGSTGNIFWIGDYGKGEIFTIEISDDKPMYLKKSIEEEAGDNFQVTDGLER